MRKEHKIINGIELKECSVCKEWKDLKEFHKNSNRWDGLRAECKECRKKEGKKYRKENKHKVLKAKKQWYNDTKLNAKERTNNQLKEVSKICNQCNQDKLITDYRERTNGGFYSICKQCENANNKIYKKENPEIIRAIHVRTEQRRRSRASKLVSDFTLEEWEYCKKYFNNKCAYCGKKTNELTQDHFIPLTKGGGYTKGNIIPSCRSCNCKKHNTNFEEWYYKQSFYSKERKDKIMNYINIQQDVFLLKDCK